MITLGDIESAARVLDGHVVETPCLHSRTLSEITGAQVYLKFENHQFTASFKERGALNKLASLSAEERARGVVAASAGNHAQGVAYHAGRLGIACTIVMPRFTPDVKVEMTRRFGAQIVLFGDDFDAARTHALALAEEGGACFVHPYDDAKVIAGQGTLALEMLRQQPDLDTLVVAIGGGGLISGVAVAGKALRPGLAVVGVQMARFASMVCALKGETRPFGPATIADGIAVREPGRITRAIVERLVDDIVLVDEGDVEQAIVLLLEIEKTVAEGAGAAGLAALLCHGGRFRGRKVGVILCGGNIDPLTLAALIERGLVRSGRLARIRVELRDLPGGLARVATVIGESNANIEEVHHQRAFTDLPVNNAQVEFVLKTRNSAHVAEIIATLKAQGFTAHPL
ncbi:MAG: threonine ammonia-lyase [Burkholderiales bacterium]|nr:threonine ammonia-lyase [Burkholderiales bacterium]